MKHLMRSLVAAGVFSLSGLSLGSTCENTGELSPLYIRGGFNAWDLVDELCYQGDSIYKTTIRFDLLAPRHFKLASEDWVSLTCTVDSKYPSEDIDELLSEEAAYSLPFGQTEKIVCFSEEDYKDQGQEVIFTGLKADFELDKTYQLTLDVSRGIADATILVEEAERISLDN